MRELTFSGFLAQYLKQLSSRNTNSLYKLAEEAGSTNPRLREPLLLYALFSGKQDVLLNATKTVDLHEQFKALLFNFNSHEMKEALQNNSPSLPAEYHKVWQTYQCQKNRTLADNHTKELMREKVKRLQAKCGVTNYRIYTDLKLNPGNLNAWLKHGDGDKVSLDVARRALHYMEGQLPL